MKCKNCNSPLPNDGNVCKFCGMIMSMEQINYQNKMKNKDDQRITLLSEKYGQNQNIEYRDKKENKLIGLIIIVIILLFLIILTILLNI